MPLGLAQQGSRLYLVCRFDGYENERSLAIHRLSKAVVSTFGFERPREFSLAKYDADGRFGFGEGRTCQITLNLAKSAANYLLETPLSEDQVIHEFDDYSQVIATVAETKRLNNWVEGFGEKLLSYSISSTRDNNDE